MFKIFLENVDRGWYTTLWILIALALICYIAVIIYFIRMKYRIRYFVDGKLVNTIYYKKNETIMQYDYLGNNEWFLDEECTNLFIDNVMPSKNLKLYSKSVHEL